MTSEVMASPSDPPEPWDMTTTENSPTTHRDAKIRDPRIRRFLGLDAALTGANGLIYLVAAAPLGEWLGMPPTLLRLLGTFLIVVAVGVAMLARSTAPPRRWVMALAEFNLIWVIASIGYAVLAADLTTLGRIWALLQAGLVGAFAAVQAWFARSAS